MQQHLICFDLDGTLTLHSTWEAFNTALGISQEDDQRLFNQYKEGNLEYRDWMIELMRLYKQGTPINKETIEKVASTVELRPSAQEAIAGTKAKGYHIIILSGGIDLIVEVIANRLGINEWLTPNKAVFDEHNELVNVEDLGHERAAKLLLLKEFCTKNNYELSEVIVVADGGNDLELFKTTKGIMLGNNPELAPFAWKQIQTLPELSALL